MCPSEAANLPEGVVFRRLRGPTPESHPPMPDKNQRAIAVVGPEPGWTRTRPPKRSRTVHEYKMPKITLVNQDGKRIDFPAIIDSGKPILLDFIFGTCSTICPVLSAGFSNFQRKLGPEVESVQLVSISIDPEHDTPEVMKEYLERYGAMPGWDFLTGSREDIDQVMHAFDAYVGDKMSHQPITFLRSPGQPKWVRIYGLMGTSDLMKEYKGLLKE